MLSCIYNGEVVYINKFEDFRDCMDGSVYEILERFIEHLILIERERVIDELDDNYFDSEDDEEIYDIDKESLLDEISDLENKVLEIESEKNEILRKIDEFLKDYSYTENYEELVEKLENLL